MNLFTEQKQAHRHKQQTYGTKGDTCRGEDELGPLGLTDTHCHV